MPKTLPIIICDHNILVKEKDSEHFVTFEMPNIEEHRGIPFYHEFAGKISECQYKFKEFVKSMYDKKMTKYVLAIIVPDDTTPLESIFINEFFLHSGACKAVAQMTMSQALAKGNTRYISVSKTIRNVVMRYINNNEVLAERYYPVYDYDPNAVKEDAKRLHIDIECAGVPVFVNNFNLECEDLLDMGQAITTKQFLDIIAYVDTEKV